MDASPNPWGNPKYYALIISAPFIKVVHVMRKSDGKEFHPREQHATHFVACRHEKHVKG